jgi:hypothetical protein
MKPLANPGCPAAALSAWNSKRRGLRRSSRLCVWQGRGKGHRISPAAKASRENEGDRRHGVPGRILESKRYRPQVGPGDRGARYRTAIDVRRGSSGDRLSLGKRSLALAFVEEGLVRPAFVVADHLQRLRELAARYADRSPDLADVCLIRLSELHPRHPVITTDVRDFRVYRRGRREAIPLIHPPRL